MPRARWSLPTLLACLIAALLVAVPAAASPGALDPAFGDDGVLSLAGDLPWAGEDGGFRGVDVLADGDLALSAVRPCGEGCHVGLLARADAAGALRGELRYAIGADGAPRLTGRVVRPNGGLALSYDDPDGGSRVRLVTPTGETADAPVPGPMSVRAVAADGAVVLVGEGRVLRLRPDLSPDPAFGAGGAAPLPAGIPAGAALAVTAGPDGVRVAAADGGALLLGRLDPTGRDLGTSRAEVPGASLAAGARVTQVVTGRGGATYAVGRGEVPGPGGVPVTRSAVVAFGAGGGADAGFGRGGAVLLPEGDARLAVDHAGRLVAVGTRPGAAGVEVVIRRLTAGGRLDEGFANRGVPTPATRLAGLDVAIDREGRIVVAAAARVPGRPAGVMLGRFLGGAPGASRG